MAVASANLVRLRELLGEPTASTLGYTPLDLVVNSPQTHDPFAISFMFQFGTLQDKSTGLQEKIWVLLYPPVVNNGPAELQFQSYDATSGTCNRFANENISTIMMEVAPAFRFKRGSRAKYESLAKYYFLEKLASQTDDLEELRVEMYISRGMLDALKNACTEFKKHSESQMPVRESRSDSVTLLGDPDEVTRSPKSEFSLVILTPKVPRAVSSTRAMSHLALFLRNTDNCSALSLPKPIRSTFSTVSEAKKRSST